MATRVQRTTNARPLVNTVHSSFITLGVIIGSSIGGLTIDAYGLRAPLWLGAALAALGLLSLLPEARMRSKPQDLGPSRASAEQSAPGRRDRQLDGSRPQTGSSSGAGT